MQIEFGKTLIFVGLALAAVGALLYLGGNFLRLGCLPGDFKWESGRFSVYLPLASSILVSIALTVLFNLFFKR